MAEDLYARLTAALADRYAIERPLGQGGMATVYLAQDLKHDRQVAIKVLKPELAAVIGGERFLTEIKTTAALQHPNILPLYDCGVADSFLYYVMPFVEGESLRADDLLFLEGRAIYEISFTPDERAAVFREGDANSGNADVGIYDFKGDMETPGVLASGNNERAIALSPDGRWLAYVSDVTGRDEVFVRPFPDADQGRRQVSTDGGREPQWSSSGDELFYRDGDGWMVAANVDGSAGFNVEGRTRLFDASLYRTDNSWHNYAVSPDDQEFLMLRLEAAASADETRLLLIRNWFTELQQRVGG